MNEDERESLGLSQKESGVFCGRLPGNLIARARRRTTPPLAKDPL
jgi:hypothetical protein